MTEKRTTEPTSEPVLLAEVKAQGRITTPDDDTKLLNYIRDARDYCERYTNCALIDQTWTKYLDGWRTEIVLNVHPVISVTSIKYIDVAGTQQTLGTGVYRVDAAGQRITQAWGQSWPSARAVTGAIEIAYKAGFKDTSASPQTGTVPPAFLRAIEMLAAYWYDCRAAADPLNLKEIPFGVKALLDQQTRYFV
jgi:uncharacterized phiE125 gp8 family phage protein